MEQALLVFHLLVENIWNQKCKEEDFVTALQKAAQLKAILWAADLMQVDEKLRLQFYRDVQIVEMVARNVLSPEVIKEMNDESKTYYGYLYAFLCQHSNDLLVIYREFPFHTPIHIACTGCGNDIHSVMVNPAELNERNKTTVIPTVYERANDQLNHLEDAEELKEEIKADHKIENERYSESRTPEGFGEKEANEWDFYTNTMRFLTWCGEEYLSGILNYLYGDHECTKCHKTEPVIVSYRKWFYNDQPNYDEPSPELISWLEGKAAEAAQDSHGETASFFHRMAVCYEMCRSNPDRKRVYDNILSYYEECRELEHLYVPMVQQVLRELLGTEFEEEKARAYNRLAAGFAFDDTNEDKNRWDLTWQAYLMAVSIYQKNQMLDDPGYWEALNGLCVTVAKGGEGNIDLADELILDSVVRLEAENGDGGQIAKAYRDLAYLWAEGAGAYEKCYAYFEKCLEISQEIYGADSECMADLYEELAEYYESDGKGLKACELREQALEINQQKAEGEKLADSYFLLGKSYYEQSMPDLAMKCFKKAESLYKREYKRKIPSGRLAQVHQFKGNIYLDKGNEKMGMKEYREAIEICNQLIEISNQEAEVELCKEILGDIENGISQ